MTISYISLPDPTSYASSLSSFSVDDFTSYFTDKIELVKRELLLGTCWGIMVNKQRLYLIVSCIIIMANLLYNTEVNVADFSHGPGIL